MKYLPKPILLSLTATLALYLAGCYTVPETGRSSLNVMPNSVLQQQASAAFQKMQEDAKISKDKEKIQRVERIGRRVLRAAGPSGDLPPPEDWKFVVFDNDEMVNAFAMPGGKVGVYTGLMKLADNDDQLAVVIAHEVAHVSARHGNERVSQAVTVSGIGAGLNVALKDQDRETRQLVMAAYGLGAQFGALLPYSRLHESEADEIGLTYMARAGYDPRAAPRFWQKMKSESEGKSPPEFLSTHPSHDTRIDKMQELMPRALKIYRKQKR